MSEKDFDNFCNNEDEYSQKILNNLDGINKDIIKLNEDKLVSTYQYSCKIKELKQSIKSYQIKLKKTEEKLNLYKDLVLMINAYVVKICNIVHPITTATASVATKNTSKTSTTTCSAYIKVSNLNSNIQVLANDEYEKTFTSIH